MAVSERTAAAVENGSFIRKMFERGNELRKKYGDDAVFDFSLGNPDAPPPAVFEEKIIECVRESGANKYGYMSNAGYPQTRAVIADRVSKEQQTRLTADDTVMTCGAGGALNVVLKTVLNPGDEVLAVAPCFMEYRFYTENHGGVFKTVPAAADFGLDVDALEAAVSPKTAALIINSPNNPTGRIYSDESLKRLGEMLLRKRKETGRTVYLISDEPYRRIVYGGRTVPSLFDKYPHSVVVNSFSKELSIPGERLGYIALNPAAEDAERMRAGFVLCNRILGFVNAPSLMQKVIARLSEDCEVDISVYDRRRQTLCKALSEIGYEYAEPEGAFYLFVKAPSGDDAADCERLARYNVLTVILRCRQSDCRFDSRFQTSVCRLPRRQIVTGGEFSVLLGVIFLFASAFLCIVYGILNSIRRRPLSEKERTEEEKWLDEEEKIDDEWTGGV